MYISKKDRELIKQKFGGKCAYTGTELLSDWQVDHVSPVRRNMWLNNTPRFGENHNLENMIPTQRLVTHYKRFRDLGQFKEFMVDFHVRISKLPKNPRTEKGAKKKKYMLEIAELFGVTPDKPFSGKFYFETL